MKDRSSCCVDYITMSNTSIIPPGAAAPVSNLNTRGTVDIDGVTLSLRYSQGPMTHVQVGATDAITGTQTSWLGWASTVTEVPEHEVDATARRLGRELLDFSNTEQLVVECIEELRRMARYVEGQRERFGKDRELCTLYKGQQLGLAAALPLIEALADRLGVGLPLKAHALQEARNAAEPPMSFAQGIAGLVGAIADGLGDRAEIEVLVAPAAALG